MVDDSIITAGIDTAKDKLDVAVRGMDRVVVFDNNYAGFKRLAEPLAAEGVGRVGIEATGGYERGVTRHLQKAGFEVLVLQPLQVRAFAKMRLQRAKNDRIDAKLIADCTHLLDVRNKLPPEQTASRRADKRSAIRHRNSPTKNTGR